MPRFLWFTVYRYMWSGHVLGWVTADCVCIQFPVRDNYVNSHSGQLSLAIPSWLGTVSTSQRAVTPCSWVVKAGMVRVWVAGQTVWSHCYTCRGLIIKRYINLSVYFSLLYFSTGGVINDHVLYVKSKQAEMFLFLLCARILILLLPFSLCYSSHLFYCILLYNIYYN